MYFNALFVYRTAFLSCLFHFIKHCLSHIYKNFNTRSNLFFFIRIQLDIIPSAVILSFNIYWYFPTNYYILNKVSILRCIVHQWSFKKNAKSYYVSIKLHCLIFCIKLSWWQNVMCDSLFACTDKSKN